MPALTATFTYTKLRPQDLPQKNTGIKLIDRIRYMKVVRARGQEVQYEA